MGFDMWRTKAVYPGFGGETRQPFDCYIKMATKAGILDLENMGLSQMVPEKAYEFLFVCLPLKIKGGTGSPSNPDAFY